MNNFSLNHTFSAWCKSIYMETHPSSLWNKLTIQFKSMRRRRVPVIQQMSAVECGAACLAMILGYYGRKMRVAECSEYCDIGRDGLTAQTIVEAARHFGLRVKAYSIEAADFQYVPLPAIIHWNFNHYMVVERWSPQHVGIVDPANGRCQLTADEFDVGFTGVVLVFEPSVHFEKRHTVNAPLWRNYLTQILHIPGLSGLLLQVFGASMLLQILGLAFPILTKVLVDQILPFHVVNLMTVLGIGIVILVLAQSVTTYLRATLLIYLQGRLDTQLMLGFFEHMLTLPYRFFQQRTSGDLLMRLGSHSLIRETLTSQSLSVVLDGLLVLVYLIILLTQAPYFGLLILGMGILQVVLLLATTRQVQDLAQRDLSAQAKSQSYLVEALTGIATLKVSGSEEQAFNHWSNLFFKHLNISLRRSHLSASIDTMLTTLRTFAPLLLLWVGAYHVLDGTMSLGTMFALNALGIAVLTPLASLVSNGQQLQMISAHLERLADVLKAEPEQDRQLAQRVPKLSGQIELNQTSYRYSAQAPLVLQDISVNIEPGQKVALVGATGSGKSTLAMLLLGLCSPTGGEIRYDGIPLQDLERRSLRRQFGVVLQEPFLFSGSIRQNITFNDPTLSLEQVVEAAKLAAIHEEIMQMPMGYDTLLSEGSNGLSGGQRQRLAIARALAHKPSILLLDEATSHLDVVTEALIDQNLSALSCTRIVIAHRLSTIRNADRIFVLKQGALIEQGTHEELLVLEGAYTKLVYSQPENQ